MRRDHEPENPPAGGEGAAMRLAAGELAAVGVDACMPGDADGRRLAIVNACRARSQLTIEDCGHVAWEYWPWSGPGTSPAAVTALVLHLLGADEGGPAPPAGPRPGWRLKGIVGRELDARGLRVCLGISEDLVAYEVTATIAVTNPARPQRGTVHLTDEGQITWDCRCGAGSETRMVMDAITPILIGGIEACRARDE